MLWCLLLLRALCAQSVPADVKIKERIMITETDACSSRQGHERENLQHLGDLGFYTTLIKTPSCERLTLLEEKLNPDH